MKTRRFCPKCGNMLKKSKLKKSENKYDFQCTICEEDFWKFEVLRKHDKERIFFLKVSCRNKGLQDCSPELELVGISQKLMGNYNRVSG